MHWGKTASKRLIIQYLLLSDYTGRSVRACVRMHVCVCVCARARVRACACVRVCACM